MSETLIGVLIGGILSGLGTWITIAIQQRRWLLETRIERLHAKRERLEVAYEKTLKDLNIAIQENSYPSNMLSDIEFLFPEAVSIAFNAFMSEDHKDNLKMKHAYYAIAGAMKKTLKNIDDQIDTLTLCNHSAGEGNVMYGMKNGIFVSKNNK